VAEWPGRRGQYRSVGVAAHLDVVPPGDLWKHPAFGGEVHGEEIWGRGTQDDKGGVAMAFAAIDILKRMGLEPRSDLRVLLGTMEETEDWRDMDLLMEREHIPEFTLVPDGAFPVIVGEKGLLTVEWRADWDPAPADTLRFVGLSGGERHNLVPPRAVLWVSCRRDEVDDVRQRLERLPDAKTVRLSRDPPTVAGDEPCFEVVFKGKAAHGAFPGLGHNAVLDALGAVASLFGDSGAGRFARFLLSTCGPSDGAGLELDQEHTRMGETTVNLGVAEMGESHARVQISLRFPIGLHLDEVKVRFRDAPKRLDGVRVHYMTLGRPHEALYLSPEDHPRLIHTLQSAYREGTGREPELASIAGTTYAKIFPLALPFGPQDESSGEEILAHQTDERITLERFTENIRVYAIALALLAFDREDVEALAAPQA
jgi:succinyl-diaminopimelate desuccinylase